MVNAFPCFLFELSPLGGGICHLLFLQFLPFESQICHVMAGIKSIIDLFISVG